jgi:hypothetical protein
MGTRGAPAIWVWRDGTTIEDAALVDWLDQQLTIVCNNIRSA